MLRLTWCDCGKTAYLYTLDENGRSTATVDPCSSCGTRADEFDCAWGFGGRRLLEAQAASFIGDMQLDPRYAEFVGALFTLPVARPFTTYVDTTLPRPRYVGVDMGSAYGSFEGVIDRAAERDEREEAFFEACRGNRPKANQ